MLIISLLNLVSCYYQEQLNPGNYKYDEEEELWLTTKDTTYIIDGKDYHLGNDTLFATLSKKLDRKTTLKTKIEIPVKNIENLEVERTNVGGTILMTIFITIGVIVILAYFASDSENSWLQ